MLVLVLALVIQDPAAEVAAELTTHATPRPLSAEAVTEESPGFLGAHRRPFTDERPLLKKWPEQGPKLLWERRTGGGYAAPAIVKGRLILFHRLAGQEIVDCLDPKTGKRLWRQAAQIIYEDAFGYSNGPRCAPLIDRGQVFTYGVDGRLQCLKLEDGKVLWKRELRKDFESPQMFFGVGTTPLLVGEHLVVNVGSPDGPCVVAFHRDSGETVWEAGEQWYASYASPVFATMEGQPRILVFGGGKSRPPVGGLSVLSPTGKLLWEFPWRSEIYYSVNAMTPVVQDSGIFIAESYGRGGVKLELQTDGTGKVSWKNTNFDPHFGTPVLVDEHLYGFAGQKEPTSELACVDWKSGKTLWRQDLTWEDTLTTSQGPVQRVMHPGRAFLMRADGAFLCMGEFGHLLWLNLTPEGPKVLARARLFFASETWTPLVVYRGLLYVCQNSRDFLTGRKQRLLCYDFRGK